MKRSLITVAVLVLVASAFYIGCNFNKVERFIVQNISSIKALKSAEAFIPDKDVVWGIDISHHQREINWKELEKNQPHFIFLKATEGKTHTDTKYQEYRNKVRQLDIPVGAYHFFSYTSDGTEQARHFIKQASLAKGDLIPVLDCEFTKGMPSRNKVTSELLKFIEEVESKMGVSPIIYCECHYYEKYLESNPKGRCPLWISNFHKEPPCDYSFWQKTDRFKHPAFRGTVDYNIFNGNAGAIASYLLE